MLGTLIDTLDLDRSLRLKTFCILSLIEHEINPASRNQNSNNFNFFLAQQGREWNISMLMNINMPILIFMLSGLKHEKIYKDLRTAAKWENFYKKKNK